MGDYRDCYRGMPQCHVRMTREEWHRDGGAWMSSFLSPNA